MSEELLNKPCVRITIIVDEETVNHGTGALIKGSGGFFVITAYHCIYGDNNQDVKLDEIIIEQQTAFNRPFSKIEIVEIVGSSRPDDWIVIKVNFSDPDNTFPIILASTSFKIDNPVHFTGFQSVSKNECRTFKSRVLNEISGKEFRITLAEKDTFKAGVDDAKGLSGSGAFILNGTGLHLIGILKSVKGDDATNDDIKCCAITDIAALIGMELTEVIAHSLGDTWASQQFDGLEVTDERNLIEKIKIVNSDYSSLKINRLCRQLALGKSELSSILDRDMSAIKFRIFEACQEELEDFIEENQESVLTSDQINELIEKFTIRGIKILETKSKKYLYPVLDDELIRQIVLDLINECYLSFDKEGLYAK